MSRTLRVGVISDTHGLLRPEAVRALAGVDQILHAGDVGSPDVLEALNAIAPVTAVRGNNDTEHWATALPLHAALTLRDRKLLVTHERADLIRIEDVGQFDIVVTGHSHKPSIERSAGTLHLNPGSAGPRRFKLPVTLAIVRIGARVDVELIDLLSA